MDRIFRGILIALFMGVFSGMSAGVSANTLYFSEPFGAGGQLFLFGPGSATGTVSGPNGFSQAFTLNADGYAAIAVSTDNVVESTFPPNNPIPKIVDAGFSVTSSDSLKGYFLKNGGDMIALIDGGKLGSNYLIPDYQNERRFVSDIYPDGVLIVQATQDNTTVFGTTLNAGQIYLSVASVGSFVSADKPVAVQLSHFIEMPDNPGHASLNDIFEQLPSVDTLSTSYLLPELPNQDPYGDAVRVVATQDNTAVTINGIAAATLNKGEFYDDRVVGGVQINASHPVLVAEFTVNSQHLSIMGNSGMATTAAMAIVPGSDQWLQDYTFAPVSSDADARTDYASIVIQTSSLASLRVGGAAVNPADFKPIASTGYSYGNIDVSGLSGAYHVSADTPFELLLAGMSSKASYLTAAGSSFAHGAALPLPHTPTPLSPPPNAQGPTAAGANTLYFQLDPQAADGPRQVSIFGPPSATGTVNGSGGFSQTFNLGAEGHAVVDLPIASTLKRERVENNGFWISSDVPVSAYYVSRGRGSSENSSDMAALIRGDKLGTEYLVAGYHFKTSDPTGGTPGWTAYDDQISVQATQDGTTVTLAPKGRAPVTVSLNAGQTYLYTADSDVTGSVVTADKPIEVQSGNGCAAVPGLFSGSCDQLLEQMPTVASLSTHYIIPRVATATGNGGFLGVNEVRVIAAADNTDVAVDGGTPQHLALKGDYLTLDLNGGAQIDATQPVLVVEYLDNKEYLEDRMRFPPGWNGDSAMAVVPGIDQWLKGYVFATPTGAADFHSDYAVIMVQTGSLDSLRVGGAPVDPAVFTPIGTSGYSYGSVDVSSLTGVFTVTADTPFGLLFAGFDATDGYFTYANSPLPSGGSSTGSNTPPIANGDSAELPAGGGDLVVCTNDYDPDGDVVTVVAVAPTSEHGGTLTLNADGSVHYTPPDGYTGADSFSYTLSDGKGGTATGHVKLTVAALAVQATSGADPSPAAPAESGGGPGLTPTTQAGSRAGLAATTGGGGSIYISELLLLLGVAALRRRRGKGASRRNDDELEC